MIETWYNQDLMNPVKVQYVSGNVFSMDNLGNKVGVNVFRDGAPVSLTGTITGNVIRSDGGTVAVVGELNGNQAWITLPQAAYAVPGRISIVIKNTVSSAVTTLCAVVANVYQSTTDVTVDPGTVIPSIEALITEIETAVASIPADYSALWTSVAPAFDSTKSYVAGQYVTYDGGMYRFLVNHSGSWAAADATAVAVGGELFDVNSAVSAIENVKMMPFSLTFEAGKAISSTGHFGDNAKRIATRKYVPVTDARFVKYAITEGYRMYGAFYNGMNDSSSFVSSFGWLTGTGIIEIPATALYLRVALASAGDVSALTVNDASNLQLTYEAQYTFDMTHSLVYRGQIGSSASAILSTLAEATEIGLYNISTNTPPSDLPSGFTGGTLAVVPAYNTNSTTTYDTQKIQILVKTSPFGMMARHNNTTGVWRDWYSLDVSQMPVIVEKTKWLALGDSITYGVYSTGPDTKVDSTNGWVKRLADSLGYTLNNQGVRGMGYIAVGGNGITWGSVLDTVETYTASDYNLITVHLGINDYNTSSITLSDLETVVKSSIQRLATKFPQTRLVFITPLNSNRRGSASTKYCYGQQYGGRSLKDIADTIKSCCDAYGVECIYATDGFLLNTFNISTLLPDETHPSDYCHTLIAKNMAHFLLD